MPWQLAFAILSAYWVLAGGRGFPGALLGAVAFMLFLRSYTAPSHTGWFRAATSTGMVLAGRRGFPRALAACQGFPPALHGAAVSELFLPSCTARSHARFTRWLLAAASASMEITDCRGFPRALYGAAPSTLFHHSRTARPRTVSTWWNRWPANPSTFMVLIALRRFPRALHGAAASELFLCFCIDRSHARSIRWLHAASSTCVMLAALRGFPLALYGAAASTLFLHSRTDCPRTKSTWCWRAAPTICMVLAARQRLPRVLLDTAVSELFLLSSTARSHVRPIRCLLATASGFMALGARREFPGALGAAAFALFLLSHTVRPHTMSTWCYRWRANPSTCKVLPTLQGFPRVLHGAAASAPLHCACTARPHVRLTGWWRTAASASTVLPTRQGFHRAMHGNTAFELFLRSYIARSHAKSALSTSCTVLDSRKGFPQAIYGAPAAALFHLSLLCRESPRHSTAMVHLCSSSAPAPPAHSPGLPGGDGAPLLSSSPFAGPSRGESSLRTSTAAHPTSLLTSAPVPQLSLSTPPPHGRSPGPPGVGSWPSSSSPSAGPSMGGGSAGHFTGAHTTSFLTPVLVPPVNRSSGSTVRSFAAPHDTSPDASTLSSARPSAAHSPGLPGDGDSLLPSRVATGLSHVIINVPGPEGEGAAATVALVVELSLVDRARLVEVVKVKSHASLCELGGAEGIAASLVSSSETGVPGDGHSLSLRRRLFGSNTYKKPPAKGFLSFVWEAFKDDPMLAIALACAALSLWFGIKEEHGIKQDFYDGLSILIAVSLVVSIPAVTNFRQARRLPRLSNECSNIHSSVIRDGRLQAVSIFDVVVGDIVCLGIGDPVPADGLFLDGDTLQVDEATVTGEINRLAVDACANPFLTSGAKVAYGSARMLVTTVGMDTTRGEMMSFWGCVYSGVSSCIRKIGTAVVVLIISALIVHQFIGSKKHKNGIKNLSICNVIKALISILLDAISIEGLPLAVTVNLAYSCAATVSITAICTNKTEMVQRKQLPMVESLKNKNHGVAVTRDGTKDAPALKEAIQGTEVAKGNLDHGFPSVATVLRGRYAYNNIQKLLQFHLTVSTAGQVINLVSTVSSGMVPFTTVQQFWLNLIMVTLGGLALATEEPDKELMNKLPDYRTKSLFVTNAMWRNLLAQALFQAAVIVILLFWGGSIFGVDEHVKKTMILNTFVLCQVFNLFNVTMPEKKNMLEGILKNRLFMGIISTTVLLQVVMVEFMNRFADTTRLDWGQWGFCVGIGFLSWPIGWAIKGIPVSDKAISEWLKR